MSLLFLYCLLLPLSICLSVSPASLYLSLLPRIALSVCHLLDVYYYSIFSLFACLPALPACLFACSSLRRLPRVAVIQICTVFLYTHIQSIRSVCICINIKHLSPKQIEYDWMGVWMCARRALSFKVESSTTRLFDVTAPCACGT